MNKKRRVKLLKAHGNFGIGCVLFTAPNEMERLVNEGIAEWTDAKLKYVSSNPAPKKK